MEFKHFFLKSSEKNEKPTQNPYFQRRLEAFLRLSPFKAEKPQSKPSQSHLDRLKKALLPLVIIETLDKLSAFQALSSGHTTNAYFKEDLLAIREKLRRIKQKPSVFLQNSIEKESKTPKKMKLVEVIARFGVEKKGVRRFFHRWRLLAFENGLRKISSFHSEIIQRQIVDQFSNIFLVSCKRLLSQAFKQIFNYSESKRPLRKKIPGKTNEIHSLTILCSVLTEKFLFLKLEAWNQLSFALESMKSEALKDKMSKESEKIHILMLFKPISSKIKSIQYFSFRKIKDSALFSTESNENLEDRKMCALQIISKGALLKKKSFYRWVFEKIRNFSTQKAKNIIVFCLISRKMSWFLLQSAFHRWNLHSFMKKDPLIIQQKKNPSSSPPIIKTSSSMDQILINKKLIVNQALVNKELEAQQKKQAEKLLKINQTLGLIEIETLINRKRRLYSRVFLNNLKVIGTFEPRRYQEYEHYLKILQEEKEILHNELEDLENYNRKFAKHLDQKWLSIWGAGSGSGGAEKSGAEAGLDLSSPFNQDEEVKVSINYLEFLEKQNVLLKEEVIRNEQRIKNEEDKYEADLNMLKENIKTLQTKIAVSGDKKNENGKEKKNNLMLKSVASIFSKKSYSHEPDISD